MKDYIINNIAVVSHVLNTLTGGSRFYTLSARTHYCAYHLKSKPWQVVEECIDTLFFWQDRHCFHEYHNETKKRNPTKLK